MKSKMSILSHYFKNRDFWACLIFAATVFHAGISTGNSFFRNDTLFLKHELFFIIVYTILYRSIPNFHAMVTKNRFLSFLLLFWLMSITFSFFNSPYGVSLRYSGRMRYIGSIIHILFALYITDFAKKKIPFRSWCFYAIPLSNLFILLVFIIKLSTIPNYGTLVSERWFIFPPFNSHIRHTGHHTLTALVVLMASVAVWISKVRSYWRPLFFIVLLPFWSFLFWQGGRSEMIAAVAASYFVFYSLRQHRPQLASTAIILCVSGIIGIVLAEYFSVFPWNGIFQAINRLVNVDIADVNRISTGRITFWTTTLISLKDYPFFGFGSMGYTFMPNRVYGVHPHNVVIQFLAEWGIVGATPLIIFLTMIFYRGYLRYRKELDHLPAIEKIVAGTVLLSLSVHSLLTGAYYHGQPSMYLAMAYGFWVAACGGDSSARSVKTETRSDAKRKR